jgi:hypothetical protein
VFKLHLSFVSFIEQTVDFMSLVVEEGIVDSEVAEHCIQTLLYSDLGVAEYHVVAVVDHTSEYYLSLWLLLVQKVTLVVRNRYQHSSKVHYLLLSVDPGVVGRQQRERSLYHQCQTLVVVEVQMEVVLVSGVEFIEEISTNNTTLDVSLEVVDQSVFQVVVMPEDFVVEEGTGI